MIARLYRSGPAAATGEMSRFYATASCNLR
jgi:hypothetical protein